MLKSGAMNVSERGRLCGLWCEKKEPSCNAAPPPPGPPPELPWLDTNYEMRQPRVEHIRSAPDGSGGWSGAFYGTYDPTAHLPSLPTPAELIDGGGAPAAFGANVSSYFGFEWTVRGGRRVFRHVRHSPAAPTVSLYLRLISAQVIRTGHDLGWLMLYTGAEGSGAGGKGGYPWDGRGMYSPNPVSTTRNASSWVPQPGVRRPRNSFRVELWTNISRWAGGDGFYFLNHGSCWKDDGRQCDGDADSGNSTDVTRCAGRGGHPLSWIHAQPTTTKINHSPNTSNGPRTAFGNGPAGP